MINGKLVLAVVPARGGSKGIPLKNLRKVGNIPLVARVGHVIREIPMIDRAVVSTDHSEIARVAAEAGLAAEFMRPPDISGDSIGDEDVLTQALAEVERLDGKSYAIIVMLQPTSPLRRPEHVIETIVKLEEEGLDAVWTLSETDSKHHPLKQLTVESGLIEHYDERAETIITRQELSPLYHRDGASYAMTRQCLLEQKNKKGKRTGYVIVDDELVNIDTERDLALADWVLSRESGR